MSGFDTSWLDLREPADHAARDAGLMRAFVDALPPSPRITDLGSGTGSTLRALSGAVPEARWTLTDHDPALLAEAQRRSPGARIEQIDLSADLHRALSIPSDAITASALIDLVSADWIDRLVAGAQGRLIYIALSYDGHERWSPAHEDDGEILAAFQSHQRGDKGFGPALGPDAARYLAEKLRGAGYSVRCADSPWVLTQGPLVQALADGVAQAAVEAGVARTKAKTWCRERRAAQRVTIGHVDLMAGNSL